MAIEYADAPKRCNARTVDGWLACDRETSNDHYPFCCYNHQINQKQMNLKLRKYDRPRVNMTMRVPEHFLSANALQDGNIGIPKSTGCTYVPLEYTLITRPRLLMGCYATKVRVEDAMQLSPLGCIAVEMIDSPLKLDNRPHIKWITSDYEWIVRPCPLTAHNEQTEDDEAHCEALQWQKLRAGERNLITKGDLGSWLQYC